MPDNLMALDDFELMTEDELPIEQHKDPNHPENADFYTSLTVIKRAIEAHMVGMRSIEVAAVKMEIRGKSHTKIAEALDVGGASVGRYVSSDSARRLKQLIRHLQQMLDGPQDEHRKNILYRIAIDNEKKRPTVTIQALDLINKMAGSYEPKESQRDINITINNELLPRGKLDELPHGMTLIEGEVEND